MSVLATFMKFEPMRELAFGSISGSYIAVGSPAVPSVRQMIVSNLTDKTLNFSFDGTTDHFVLAANTQFVSDITTNRTLNHLFLGKGVSLYVKHRGSAPTSGSVVWSTMYGSAHASSSET